MKKSFISKVILLAGVLILALTLNVQAATTPCIEDLNDGKEYFFANGTAITITERTDAAPGATITWDGGSINVGPEAYIFGGMHNDNTAVTSNIVMNGGTVRNIMGGGLHLSNTTTANVTINGGTVNAVGGAGIGSGASIGRYCSCGGYSDPAGAADATQSACKVGTANVTINGGTINVGVYGAGLSGISRTDATNVKMAGGSTYYLLAGGSNGYTGTANLVVTGGTAQQVSTVNRGTMNSATVEVTGGNITTLYVAAAASSDATGTLQDVAVSIGNNATVTTLSYGNNAGTTVDPTSGNITAEDVKVSSAANIGNRDTLTNTITTTYTVTIDGKAYTLEAGKTIKDIPGYDALITRDGSDFAGFVSNGSMFDPNTVITSNIEMKTAFAPKAAPASPESTVSTTVEPEKDDTPKTGIDNLSAYVIIIGMISLMGIIVIKK